MREALGIISITKYSLGSQSHLELDGHPFDVKQLRRETLPSAERDEMRAQSMCYHSVPSPGDV